VNRDHQGTRAGFPNRDSPLRRVRQDARSGFPNRNRKGARSGLPDRDRKGVPMGQRPTNSDENTFFHRGAATRGGEPASLP
jgi:hypothetical protein